MLHEDPRDYAPEVENDPKTSPDQEKEIKTEKDDAEGTYQYTDWASI